MIGLGVNCSRCGQTFVLGAAVADDAVAYSSYEDEFSDDGDSRFDERQATDSSTNIDRLSTGFWLLSRGWVLLVVSLVLLGATALVGRSDRVPPGFVDTFAVVTLLLIAATAVSLLMYVAGQTCCLLAHRAGSDFRASTYRASIGKSLAMSTFGVLLRIAAASMNVPVLKSVASFVSASAFNHLLNYLSLVSLSFGDFTIHLDVTKLGQLYHKFFSVLIIGLVLFVAVPVPGRMLPFLALIFITGLVIFFVVFSLRFGAILFRLHRSIAKQKLASKR